MRIQARTFRRQHLALIQDLSIRTVSLACFTFTKTESPPMIVRNIEYLIALEKEGHFGRAAERCNVSQPTLSAGIRQLEQTLNVEIVRHGRRFDGFTREGLTVLEWSRKLHANCLGLEADIASQKKNLEGSLRLGVSVSASAIGASLSVTLTEFAPDLEQYVTAFDPIDSRSQISDQKFDFALTDIDDLRDDEFDIAPVYRDGLMLLTAAEQPLSEELPWNEAFKRPLCILDSSLPSWALDEVVGSTSQHIRTNSLEVLTAHLISGRFGTILPTSMSRAMSVTPSIRRSSIADERTTFGIGLLTLKGGLSSPLAKVVLKATRSKSFRAAIDNSLRWQAAF